MMSVDVGWLTQFIAAGKKYQDLFRANDRPKMNAGVQPVAH